MGGNVLRRNRKLLTDFSVGEVDPRLLGRFDNPLYQKGVKYMKNLELNDGGGLQKMPGVKFIQTSSMYVAYLSYSMHAIKVNYDTTNPADENVEILQIYISKTGTPGNLVVYARTLTQNASGTGSAIPNPSPEEIYEYKLKPRSVIVVDTEDGFTAYVTAAPPGWQMESNVYEVKYVHSTTTLTVTEINSGSGHWTGITTWFTVTAMALYDGRLILLGHKYNSAGNGSMRFAVSKVGDHTDFTALSTTGTEGVQDDLVVSDIPKWIITYNSFMLVGTNDGVYIMKGSAEDGVISTTVAPSVAFRKISNIPSEIKAVKYAEKVIMASSDRKNLISLIYQNELQSVLSPSMTPTAKHLFYESRIQNIISLPSKGKIFVFTETSSVEALQIVVGNINKETGVISWARYKPGYYDASSAIYQKNYEICTDGTFVYFAYGTQVLNAFYGLGYLEFQDYDTRDNYSTQEGGAEIFNNACYLTSYSQGTTDASGDLVDTNYDDNKSLSVLVKKPILDQNGGLTGMHSWEYIGDYTMTSSTLSLGSSYASSAIRYGWKMDESLLVTLPNFLGFPHKNKRIYAIATFFHKTGRGVKIGKTTNNMEDFFLPNTGKTPDESDLYTGVVEHVFPGSFSEDCSFAIKQSTPNPMEILGLYVDIMDPDEGL